MAYILNAFSRQEKVDKTRKDGNIPAVVYGAASDVHHLSVSYKEFAKLFKDASESTLIDLNIDGSLAGKILVQDVQFDPVSGKFLHVDFRRIDMSKPITTTVEIIFIGEPPVVKEMGGTIVHNVEEIQVKCLPKDLPESIKVDLSVLKTFEDMIKVKDLQLPVGVEVLSPPQENVVVKGQRALTEAEIKAMEETAKTADISKIEVAKKKETDEEEMAEGEAAPVEKKEEKKEEKK
ncbi:MAG: 50S ribosomal protein L25 [Candidatus Magasanikbacteria bacterium]